MAFEWEGEGRQPRNELVRFELETMHTLASAEAKKTVAMLVIRQPDTRARHMDPEAGGSGFKPPLCLHMDEIGKFYSLSVSQFPHLYNANNKSSYLPVVGKVKGLSKC